MFAAVVFISFLYLISNGALSWGPAKRLVGAMPSRTSESTIARIRRTGGSRRSVRPSATSPTDPRCPSSPIQTPAPTGPGRAA